MSYQLLLLILLIVMASGTASPQTKTVIIRPVEIQDVLVNPGMGITTFQRFNGDPLNPDRTWSEAGPTTVVALAPVKPDFPDASIAYCRWFWETK